MELGCHELGPQGFLAPPTGVVERVSAAAGMARPRACSCPAPADACGGGILWRKGNDFKSGISTQLYLHIAMLM